MDENEKKEDILLSEQEVDFALKFAESMNGWGFYGKAITPALLNQRLQEINVNPLQATENDLNQALLDPKNSELVLQEFGQNFEIQSQVYKKLLSYLGTMLSFDLSYECINAKPSDYTSTKYNKDLDVLKKFIDNFDFKNEFSVVVQELLRSEAYFGCPRFDNDKMVLQELPSLPTYSMITGRFSYGLLFSFNMYWFLNPGVSIDLYPTFFKQKFNEIFNGSNIIATYNPALMPSMRGSSSWVYWQDISPDVGWCFKFSPAQASRIPHFAGLFLDIIGIPFQRALQKNINMASASKLLVGEIPLLSKTSQASVRDQFAIGSKNLGEFMALIKAAIGDALKVATAPLTNIQGVEFTPDHDLFGNYLRNVLASSGINTNLIFTSDVRPNSIESQLSLNVDEAMMTSLYPQFESFMNYHINKMTKNFKFKVHFKGTHFYNNRQQRLDSAMTLANAGIVLPQEIAGAIGLNPFEFQRQLEEAQSTGWVDKLTPIISAFQQSGKDSGRPQMPDGKISDAGENTRSTGANVEKTQS